MTDKASKEQIPALLAELVNRESNLKTIEILQSFLATVHVAGQESVGKLNRCFAWLSGVSQGEAARVKELKELLPDKDTTIDLGKSETPHGDAPVVPPPDPEVVVGVGAIEMSKGEEVLR